MRLKMTFVTIDFHYFFFDFLLYINYVSFDFDKICWMLMTWQLDTVWIQCISDVAYANGD